MHAADGREVLVPFVSQLVPEVDVPGGRLTVDVRQDTTVLRGPAVVVAAGELTREWLEGPADSG